MKIVSDIAQWQALRRTLQGTVGFVPTMGNLHAGHIALCERARRENDCVVVSVFVNPTQFNQKEDFEKYQRTLKEDCALLEQAGVDYLLHPDAQAMYPDNYEVRVDETVVSAELEGAFRPGHFQGMLTVVLKLLNLANATRAYFGEKDFQQLILVQKMAQAFFLPVEIIPCATVRAESGLALSSRNNRLTPDQREKAAVLSALLRSTQDDEAVERHLTEQGFRVEYVATRWGRRLAAAWFHEVRLIDNVAVEQGEAKHVHCA